MIAVVAVVVGAGPVAADPAVPTNFTSAVTDEPEGVQLDVVGNDAFVEMSVTEGVEVIVLGYYLEPYLRVSASGLVERNVRSPATYLNDDRFAETNAPPRADPEAEPRWDRVGVGGSYVWHDHRTHWMLSEAPASTDGATGVVTIEDWELPMVVDGVRTAALGRLDWHPDNSAWGWWAAAVVVAGTLAVASIRALRFVAPVVLAIAALALVAGTVAWLAQPAEGRGVGIDLVLPLAAVVAGVVAVVVRPLFARWAAATVAGAATGGWALGRLDVFARPFLPTDLETLDRAATAASLASGAVAIASALAVAWRPSLLRDPGAQAAGRSSGPTER